MHDGVGRLTENGSVDSNQEDVVALGQNQKYYSEIADIFPALQKYKDDHNTANLQKLCVEISEFCRSVYASTRDEKEREIYKAMIQKLNK